MKNRYEKNAKISEREFRLVLKAFALDIPALSTAKLYGMNYRTIHRLYALLRERLVSLVLSYLSLVVLQNSFACPVVASHPLRRPLQCLQ